MLSGICVWRGQVKKLTNVFKQMNPQLFTEWDSITLRLTEIREEESYFNKRRLWGGGEGGSERSSSKKYICFFLNRHFTIHFLSLALYKE